MSTVSLEEFLKPLYPRRLAALNPPHPLNPAKQPRHRCLEIIVITPPRSSLNGFTEEATKMGTIVRELKAGKVSQVVA